VLICQAWFEQAWTCVYDLWPMSISLGFMLRIDAFPPAVAVPPLPEGLRSLRPVIDAEKVVEPTAIAGTTAFHRGSGASHSFAAGGYANASVLAQTQLLTYARDGGAGVLARAVSGRLLNIYA